MGLSGSSGARAFAEGTEARHSMRPGPSWAMVLASGGIDVHLSIRGTSDHCRENGAALPHCPLQAEQTRRRISDICVRMPDAGV